MPGSAEMYNTIDKLLFLLLLPLLYHGFHWKLILLKELFIACLVRMVFKYLFH